MTAEITHTNMEFPKGTSEYIKSVEEVRRQLKVLGLSDSDNAQIENIVMHQYQMAFIAGNRAGIKWANKNLKQGYEPSNI